MEKSVDWSGMHKAEVRKMALRNDGPCKRYVCLPGKKLRCIKEGFATGKLTPETAIYAVERDKNVSVQLANDLNTLPTRHTELFEGDLTGLTLDQPTDFAFFDLCDELTEDTILWLTTKQVKFTDGARVGFTFACFRGSAWYRRFAENVTKRQLFDMLAQDRPVIESFTKSSVGAEAERSRLKLLLAAYSVKCALWGYNARATAMLSYTDTYPMYFVEFELRQRSGDHAPHHPDVVECIHDLHRQKRLQEWPHWFRVGNMIKEHYGHMGVNVGNAYAVAKLVQDVNPRARTQSK